jgi:hypothetical protein
LYSLICPSVRPKPNAFDTLYEGTGSWYVVTSGQSS